MRGDRGRVNFLFAHVSPKTADDGSCAHQFLSSIKERVFDDAGNDISDQAGFPIVFHTMEARSGWQSEAEAAVDGPLPQHAVR